MATIKEIAKKSGYSPATVSRLLNNDQNLSISPSTRNKITSLAIGTATRKTLSSNQSVLILLYCIG